MTSRGKTTHKGELRVQLLKAPLQEVYARNGALASVLREPLSSRDALRVMGLLIRKVQLNAYEHLEHETWECSLTWGPVPWLLVGPGKMEKRDRLFNFSGPRVSYLQKGDF